MQTLVRGRDRELRERALRVIPNGMYGHESTALLPASYPQFFKRADGCRIWDADDNNYVDYMCAFGPNLLGYGFDPVNRAALQQLALGDTMTGPSEIIVELAEAFVGMISHADWAIFCKNGTDATSMALVTARAHRNRRKILCATGAYHGAAPWCTPLPAGTLPDDRAHIVYYRYNDAQSLEDAFRAHAGDVAGVFATPFRHEVFADQHDPDPEYAAAARRLCTEHEALLIVDDIRAGFRLDRECSWASLGVAPDLSTWGKCIANGFPISAMLGSDVAREAAGKAFFTGSFWFSAVPMAAAIETLRQIRETDYLERTVATGRLLRDGIDQLAQGYGYELRQTGPVQMPQILFADDPDFKRGYAWADECVRRGVYFSPYHNMFLSSAHEEGDIRFTLEACDDAFRALKAKDGNLPEVTQLAALG